MTRDAPGGTRAILPAALLGGGLVALVALWHAVPVGDALAPETLATAIEAARRASLGPLVAVLAVFLGSLMLAPILLLITATALVLGPVTGFLCALTGAMASAVVGFALGRALGRRPVERLARRWRRVDRVLGVLHDHGLKTVIVARVLPVLLYGLVSIACGATGMRWRPYLWGTLIGMAPVIAAASLFGEGLNQMVRAGTVLQTVPVAIGLVAVVLLARLGWAWLAREG